MRMILRGLLFWLSVVLLTTLASNPTFATCPPVAALPPPAPVCFVDGLTVTGAAIAWGPPAVGCGVPLYDVLVGDLGLAWASKDVGGSFLGCLAGEDDAPGPPAAAHPMVPPLGSGFWYVSRAALAGGPDFTWNETGGTQVYDRDVLLPAALCP